MISSFAVVVEPILVIGATGTHGGAVAGALLAASFTVHALVRNPRSDRAQALAENGVQLITGDLEDVSSLVRAFDGVAAAYAVTTPFEGGADEEERQGENIIAAAQEANLGWLLLASVAAADRAPVPHFQSKARIERRLRATALPWTVIAPSYFYENVLGSRTEIRAGRLPIAVPADKPLQQVALGDLGSLVVAVLGRRAEHLSLRVEAAGDAPTPAAMAAAIGVRYEPVALDVVRKRNADLAAMYAFLSGEGYAIDVPGLRAAYPEVAWSSFANWAAGIDWH
jgi:uncharacterized protein YbjT (DUF2867 family)